MFFKTLTVILSLAGAVTPYPSTSAKRADTTGLKLYAYGTGISGLEVYGGDDGEKNKIDPDFCFFPNHFADNLTGKAYLSTESASNLTQLACKWPHPWRTHIYH